MVTGGNGRHLDSCARTNLQGLLPISFAACGPETVLTHDAARPGGRTVSPCLPFRYWATLCAIPRGHPLRSSVEAKTAAAASYMGTLVHRSGQKKTVGQLTCITF
jgi:hypothetical protein